MEETDPKYLPPPTPKAPLKSPLKSALKSPGAPPKNMNAILSPTFKEDEVLEKAEEDTDKVQEQDLVGYSHVDLELSLTSVVESQDPSTNGKVGPKRCQL
jgi:hypothetical protein